MIIYILVNEPLTKITMLLFVELQVILVDLVAFCGIAGQIVNTDINTNKEHANLVAFDYVILFEFAPTK